MTYFHLFVILDHSAAAAGGTVIQAVEIGQIFNIKILKERPEIIVGYIQGFQKMCGMRAFWSFMT
jgi:hypothetical protein